MTQHLSRQRQTLSSSLYLARCFPLPLAIEADEKRVRRKLARKQVEVAGDRRARLGVAAWSGGQTFQNATALLLASKTLSF